MTQRLYALIIILIVVFADQLSKWYVLEYFLQTEGRPIGFVDWFSSNMRNPFYGVEVLPFFNLVMVWNEGISFGMLKDFGDMPLILAMISGFVAFVLFIWMIRTGNALQRYVLALIIGGAIGNIIDRVRFGAVADFLDFHAFGYHFPAFNVADAAISLGVVFLLLHNIFLNKDVK